MLSKLDEMRLDKEELELGQTIAHFMENKKVVGLFTVHGNSYIAKWLKLNFRGLTYKNSRLFDPTDNEIEEDQDPSTYEGILMLEIKYNQKQNHIKTKKTSIVEFGYKKFIPALHVIFEIDLTPDDEEIFQGDRIRDGLLAWKEAKNIK